MISFMGACFDLSRRTNVYLTILLAITAHWSLWFGARNAD
jgi:hypothetical protein